MNFSDAFLYAFGTLFIIGFGLWATVGIAVIFQEKRDDNKVFVTTIVGLILTFMALVWFFSTYRCEIEPFTSNSLTSLESYIQNTQINNKQQMYAFLNEIGGRFSNEGGENEQPYGTLIQGFSERQQRNPEQSNDMLNALSDLVGIPTETAENIAREYAAQSGFNAGTTDVFVNILAYNITRTRVESIEESFSVEQEAELINTVQTAYLGNNTDLLKFMKEVQSMYLRSNDSTDKHVGTLMSPFIVYLTMQPTAAVAIRNALNFTSGNPALAVVTTVRRFANVVNMSPENTIKLRNAMVDQVLKARHGPVSLDPVLKGAPYIKSRVPWAPTGLRETFSTAAKTQLSRIVRTAYVPDNKSALNLMRKVGHFYINNGDIHEKNVGAEIMQMVIWLESRPQEQVLLRRALVYPRSNPAFTLNSLIVQYTDFTDKSFEVKNQLNGVLVYDLIQMRHGPRY